MDFDEKEKLRQIIKVRKGEQELQKVQQLQQILLLKKETENSYSDDLPRGGSFQQPLDSQINININGTNKKALYLPQILKPKLSPPKLQLKKVKKFDVPRSMEAVLYQNPST